MASSDGIKVPRIKDKNRLLSVWIKGGESEHKGRWVSTVCPRHELNSNRLIESVFIPKETKDSVGTIEVGLTRNERLVLPWWVCDHESRSLVSFSSLAIRRITQRVRRVVSNI